MKRLLLLLAAVLATASAGRRSIDPRIFNGTKVSGEFKMPWLVGVVVVQKDVAVSTCGGALLNNQTILTAAQCVYMAATSAEIFVLIESIDASTSTFADPAVTTNLVAVTNHTIHSGFLYNTREFDFAVLKIVPMMPENVTHKAYVGMPSAGMLKSPDFFANKTAIAYGWGADPADANHATTSFKYSHQKVLMSKMCNDTLAASLWQYYPASQMCVDTSNKQSSACSKDIGGPVTVQMPSFERPTLIGVVSWYADCGTTASATPNVVARLGAKDVLKWIAKLGGPSEIK